LLQWAVEQPKRLSIWQIENKTVADFPDNDTEWCALNFRDETGGRGIVVAFGYTSGAASVKYRCYFENKWYGNWKNIV
jgi:hypothetical protein